MTKPRTEAGLVEGESKAGTGDSRPSPEALQRIVIEMRELYDTLATARMVAAAPEAAAAILTFADAWPQFVEAVKAARYDEAYDLLILLGDAASTLGRLGFEYVDGRRASCLH